jgi:hypothetical protein
MKEPNNLETTIVVTETPNPRAREILMPPNQSRILENIGTLRPEFGNAVPNAGSLHFLQSYSRRKMEWFVAGGVARRADLVANFKLKALTRWLVGPLPDAIAGARNFVNAAEWPPVESAETLVRMISNFKNVFPADTFDEVQGMYLYYADLDGIYQLWSAVAGYRAYPFPRLPNLEQVKRQMLFRFYQREDREIIGHQMTFKDGISGEEYWASYHGIKKYLYPRRAQGQDLYPPIGFSTEVGMRRSVSIRHDRMILEWCLNEKTFVQSGEWHFFPRLVIARYYPVTGLVKTGARRPSPNLVHALVIELLLSM